MNSVQASSSSPFLISDASDAIFDAMEKARDSAEEIVRILSQATPDQLNALFAVYEEIDCKQVETKLQEWIRTEIGGFDITRNPFSYLEEKINQINALGHKLEEEREGFLERIGDEVMCSFNTLFFGSEDSPSDRLPLQERSFTVPIWAELERCVQKLPPLEERDTLFAALLEEFASRGAFTDAKRLLRQIEDPSLRQHGLEVLSHQTLLLTQNLEEAMQHEFAIEQLDLEEAPSLDPLSEPAEAETLQNALTIVDETERKERVSTLILRQTGLHPQKIRALFERYPQFHGAFQEALLAWAQNFMGKDQERAETDSLIRHICILAILSNQLCQQPLMEVRSIPLAPLTCLGLELERAVSLVVKDADLFLQALRPEFFVEHFPSLQALIGSIPQNQIKEPLYEQLFALLLQKGAFDEAEEVVQKMANSLAKIRCLARLSILIWLSAFKENENKEEIQEGADRCFRVFRQNDFPQKEALWARLLREKTIDTSIDYSSEQREEFMRWALQTLEQLHTEDHEVQQLIRDLQSLLSPSGGIFQERKQVIGRIVDPSVREQCVLTFWEQLDPSLEDPALFRWFFQEIDRFSDRETRKNCLTQLQQKVSLLAQGWYGENKGAYQELKQEIDQRLRAGDGSAPKKQKEKAV